MVDRSGVLKFSPLACALASIRFAPWALLSKNLPDIQDELREIAPLINNIEIQIQQGPRPTDVVVKKVWMLLSPDRSLGIQLAEDQLLVFSTKYLRFTEFAEILKQALAALLTPARMRFMDVLSVGVRYVDHVQTKGGRELKDFIAPSFLAPSIQGFTTEGGVVLGAYKLDESLLQVRCISQPGAAVLPEDLISLLAMAQEPGKPPELGRLEKEEFTLDIDSIQNFPAPKRMSIEDMEILLDNLHTKANTFFRSEHVCTDTAFKIWKGEH